MNCGPRKGRMRIAMSRRLIKFILNGQPVERDVSVRRHLTEMLREDFHLTGSHLGCEQGFCGACSVRVDSAVIRGCLMLAVQAHGKRIDTIEGVSVTEEIGLLQEAFIARNALQCGFCTPGMLLSSQELLEQNASPTRSEIREHLSGNYCRCTGYHAIVDAVEAAGSAKER